MLEHLGHPQSNTANTYYKDTVIQDLVSSFLDRVAETLDNPHQGISVGTQIANIGYQHIHEIVQNAAATTHLYTSQGGASPEAQAGCQSAMYTIHSKLASHYRELGTYLLHLNQTWYNNTFAEASAFEKTLNRAKSGAKPPHNYGTNSHRTMKAGTGDMTNRLFTSAPTASKDGSPTGGSKSGLLAARRNRQVIEETVEENAEVEVVVPPVTHTVKPQQQQYGAVRKALIPVRASYGTPKQHSVPEHLNPEPIDTTPGSDPVFNSVALNMHRLATQKVQDNFTELGKMAEADAVAIPDSGIVEDMDDLLCEPSFVTMSASELADYEARVGHSEEGILGMEVYDKNTHPKARYPIEFPFPKAYDPLRQVKHVFVKDNVIIEIIKELDMEMQDHILEDLSLETDGKKVNILAILEGIPDRLNTATNRKSKPADEEKGIEGIIATADTKAFPEKAVVTTGNEVCKAIIDKMQHDREVRIEGYHEKRITPLFIGPDAEDVFTVFRNKIVAASTFAMLVSVLKVELPRMPESFATAYRDKLTRIFNDFLSFRLGIGYRVDDFVNDYDVIFEEVVKAMGKNIALDKFSKEFRTFSRVAKILPVSAETYKEALPESLTGEGFYAMQTTITTLIVPFTSEEATGVLPGPKDGVFGVTESETPRLVNLFKALRKSAAETLNQAANVTRLITKDNVEFYVHAGLFGDEHTYVVTRKSFLLA